MSTYKNIIFDLDGTLTNPYQGALNSLRYALNQLKFNELPEEVPSTFIGPPLQKSFKEIYGLNEKHTKLAVEYYREYYGRVGLYENFVYEGIAELLENLFEQGKRVYVATSKLEESAWEIIKHFELDKYIDDLQGADYAGNHTKAALIGLLMDKYQMTEEDTIMVGDTKFDILGANEVEIDSIAVGYGFGKLDNLMALHATYGFIDVEGLSEFLV